MGTDSGDNSLPSESRDIFKSANNSALRALISKHNIVMAEAEHVSPTTNTLLTMIIQSTPLGQSSVVTS